MAEDDVWLASLGGGRAWRLSGDRVPVSHPRLSTDGTQVAWTSWRDGDPEVQLASVDGGLSERLTYWGSASTRVRGWTPGGRVLATSSAGQPFSHYTWAFAVPVDGSTAARLPYGPVDDIALAGAHRSEKAALLTGGAGEPARWKRYRGGGMGRLWTGDALEPAEYRTDADGDLRVDDRHFTRIQADIGGHLDSVLIVGDRIAFLSDHEGIGTLYSCTVGGDDLRRHSDNATFYARQAATDGTRVVYASAGQLWLLDDLDTAPRLLGVELGGAATARRPRLVTGEDRLGGFSCDETGRASAVEVAGTIQWVTHRHGPARTLAADPRARARLPAVLGRDTGGVAWIMDAGTDLPGDALEVAPAAGIEPGSTPRRLAAGRLGWAEDLVAAPDGLHVAVTTRDGRLVLVEIESGETTDLAVTANGRISDVVFSPDSEWLAWSEPETDPLRRIRLARLADRTIVDVTDGRFEDTAPAFTLDGKFLAFLSWRGFDPVYDQHVFDLSFPFGCRPYLVPLAAATPSPFAPSVEGRAANGEDDKKEEEKKEEQRAVVDLEGLPARMVPFPVEASRYAGMSAVKGGVVWMKIPLSGELGESGPALDTAPLRPSLERFDLTTGKCEELADTVDSYAVSGDGERLVVRDRGRLRVVPSGSPAGDDDVVKVDLSRARTTIDPTARWRLAYAEAGRVIRHEFWREDLLADVIRWDEVLERYRPLLDRVATPDDFADLMWELLGELGTSHAYASRAGYARAGEWLGMLGTDLIRDGEVWRIIRILPGESSDPRARSPLSGPGVVVRPGDGLLEIDGVAVDPVTGPGPLLAGMADTPVELTIGPRDGGTPRRVAVVPLLDDERLRYQDWVSGRRQHVRAASGGRLGYLHIPDMVGFGWAQLHRDLRVEMAHDGIIVDLRGNRGGHTSQLVVEKLSRKIIGWDVPRNRRPSPYPENAPRGPIVAVVDERAGSDGDIISAAIKTLGLGKVVGTRTWGGVVGIDGWHRLADGTSITAPKYATWFDAYGWDLENRGVEPDLEVVMTPEDWVAGRDPQLDAAVEIALTELAGRPPLSPPTR
ncbi:MAG: S41 family peptidase [Streptosporangiaceae bacterium]